MSSLIDMYNEDGMHRRLFKAVGSEEFSNLHWVMANFRVQLGDLSRIAIVDLEMLMLTQKVQKYGKMEIMGVTEASERE